MFSSIEDRFLVITRFDDRVESLGTAEEVEYLNEFLVKQIHNSDPTIIKIAQEIIEKDIIEKMRKALKQVVWQDKTFELALTKFKQLCYSFSEKKFSTDLNSSKGSPPFLRRTYLEDNPDNPEIQRLPVYCSSISNLKELRPFFQQLENKYVQSIAPFLQEIGDKANVGEVFRGCIENFKNLKNKRLLLAEVQKLTQVIEDFVNQFEHQPAYMVVWGHFDNVTERLNLLESMLVYLNEPIDQIS